MTSYMSGFSGIICTNGCINRDPNSYTFLFIPYSLISSRVNAWSVAKLDDRRAHMLVMSIKKLDSLVNPVRLKLIKPSYTCNSLKRLLFSVVSLAKSPSLRHSFESVAIVFPVLAVLFNSGFQRGAL